MRDDPVKIGVIGCGMIGREHIKRLQHRIQGCHVTAVCDVFAKNAEAGAELAGGAAVYTDFHEMIASPDVDAVVVTTPGHLHKEPVLAAIRAGKHVFTEKPLCTTAADCRAIVDAELGAGRRLVQVGFMRRYDRGYNQVKALLDSGEFGAPLLLKCTHRAESVADSYTTEMAVTDTAIHEIDVLPWLIGGDPWDTVQCILPRSTQSAHAGLQDPQVMLLKTKGGVVCVLEVFVNCGFGYDINCEVVCERGVIHLPAPSFPTVRKDFHLSTKIENNWILRFIDSYDVELQDWANSLRSGIPVGSSAWDGYVAELTADTLVAAQKSGGTEAVLTGEKPALYQS